MQSKKWVPQIPVAPQAIANVLHILDATLPPAVAGSRLVLVFAWTAFSIERLRPEPHELCRAKGFKLSWIAAPCPGREGKRSAFADFVPVLALPVPRRTLSGLGLLVPDGLSISSIPDIQTLPCRSKASELKEQQPRSKKGKRKSGVRLSRCRACTCKLSCVFRSLETCIW